MFKKFIYNTCILRKYRSGIGYPLEMKREAKKSTIIPIVIFLLIDIYTYNKIVIDRCLYCTWKIYAKFINYHSNTGNFYLLGTQNKDF